jgi:surface carbohydrate biosynthesis protein
MKVTKATLLIPVEHQVRELDAKLLLACVAARRGFASVVGPRVQMHFHIPSLPRGIYLSKSMTRGSVNVFRVLRMLGHHVVGWDEEALVHLPPEIYYPHRLSPVSLTYVSHLLAWGEDSAQLWQRYPGKPPGTSVHITGNPRGDLLRPELRGFYARDVESIRRAYGHFILVNTNFSHVNAFYSNMNLFWGADRPGEGPRVGRRVASMGVSREYAEGLRDHKQAIFEHFQRLIPDLERAFPGYTIVVRPHPAENHKIYREIAAKCKAVRVTDEGNVVPWLMAATALVHNGCTTGVEAYVMGVPAITYRPTVNETYDHAFHHLPNLLSHQCFSFEELRATLGKILGGEIGAADGDERKALIDHHLAALDGRLACERMVDVLDGMMEEWSENRKPAIGERLKGWAWATKRRVKKRFRGYLPSFSHNRPEYFEHCYPAISLEEMRGRVLRLQRALGDNTEIRMERTSGEFYRLSC